MEGQKKMVSLSKHPDPAVNLDPKRIGIDVRTFIHNLIHQIQHV